jgi:hypothetical protein
MGTLAGRVQIGALKLHLIGSGRGAYALREWATPDRTRDPRRRRRTVPPVAFGTGMPPSPGIRGVIAP